MKIQTINQLISVFKDIATRHYQINGFGIGDSWEIGADKAYMHPVLWINPTTANMPSTDTGYKTFEIDFDVRVFDLVHKDESNENEVLSDTIDILKDIITEFKSHPYYVNSQLNITGDISFEAFTEEFDEEVSGWLCEISLMTPILTSFCGIPAADITGFEFPGVDCPDVNVLCPVFIDEIIGVEPIVVTSDGTTRTISLNGSSIIGADNGLNVLGGVVELGGTLNKDTTILGDSNDLTIGSPTSKLDNYNINSIEASERYGVPGGVLEIDKNPGGFNLSYVNTTPNYESKLEVNSGTGNLYAIDWNTGVYSGQYITTGSSKQLTTNGVGWKSEVETTVNYFKASYIDPTFTSTMLLGVSYNLQTEDFNVNSTNFDISPIGGLLKFNYPTTKGIEYDADYSVNFSNRSLVDKGYVDTAITNHTTTGFTGTFTNGDGNTVTVTNGLITNIV
tara:strand:+ start:4591 stop:5940 length:1350 start_codon:yes stop_codon:yes gene_type:complete